MTTTPIHPSSSEGCSLPTDVLRDIFEMAATESMDHAKQLTLVSKETNHWIEPLLYRLLVSCSALDRIHPILRFYMRNKQITPRLIKICTYAHHVLLQGLPVLDAVEILKLCTNAWDIALWILWPERSYEQLLEVIGQMPLRRMSVNVGSLFRSQAGAFEFKPNLLQNVTHLDAIALVEGFWDTEWAGFGKLPKLSHLAIDPPASRRRVIINGILGTNLTDRTHDVFSSLKVLLVIAPDWKSSDADIEDSRLVHIPGLLNPIGHWFTMAKGIWSMWREAEKMQETGGGGDWEPA